MDEKSIGTAALSKAVLSLYEEGFDGPAGSSTWFTDGGPGSGFLGTIEGLSAAEASRPLHQGDPVSLASHVAHLQYSLSLANRAAKGENPYKDANWSLAWKTQRVEEAEWRALVGGLRFEYEAFKKVLAAGWEWADADSLTGAIATVAHGAWHLGAIRQALGLVKAPKT
ncbi:MAG TPA: hypothetical protein VMV44_01245 [Rectinemataceae bacterium]|nr:hypothetical protein [Rectinemataceae bacterium]